MVKVNYGGTFKTTKPFLISPITTPYDAQLANAKAAVYTPAQLRTIANQQVDAQITSAVNQSNILGAAEQKQYTDLANRAAGLAQALGSFGADYGQNAFNAYNQAAQTIGQLGTGLTGVVAADWQAEQTANRQAVNQALGEGVGKVTSYDPGALRSAAQYTGVTLPGAGLANAATSAREMAQYGAMADKAQVASVSRDYIAQAKAALDKRSAERAAIVAQRPELFQTALQAQREDNAKTQARIDQLISASTTYLQNEDKIKQATIQADRNWWLAKQSNFRAKTKAEQDKWLQKVAATHIDPDTGEPIGGWTWADKTHTTVVPWTSLVAANQAGQRIEQGNRQLDITEQHYTDMKQHYDDMYSAAQRANNLRAQAANKPGDFDKNMSAAVGYISDGQGHPIVTRDGKPVAYKIPGKAPKPMDTKTQLQIRGTMADYAAGLKDGATDPETGATIIPKVDVQQAIGMFAVRGYLSGKLASWGLQALGQAYGYTPEQIVSIAEGVDPSHLGYGPFIDEATLSGKKAGGTAIKAGDPWNEGSDPIVGKGKKAGTFKTKSGRTVVKGGIQAPASGRGVATWSWPHYTSD